MRAIVVGRGLFGSRPSCLLQKPKLDSPPRGPDNGADERLRLKRSTGGAQRERSPTSLGVPHHAPMASPPAAFAVAIPLLLR